MADRVSQLQQKLNQLAEQLCNSVGVLQNETRTMDEIKAELEDQLTADCGADQFEKRVAEADVAALFARLLTRTSRELEILVDALPGESVTPESQTKRLMAAKTADGEANTALEQTVLSADQLLASVQRNMATTAGAIGRLRMMEAELLDDISKDKDNLALMESIKTNCHDADDVEKKLRRVRNDCVDSEDEFSSSEDGCSNPDMDVT